MTPHDQLNTNIIRLEQALSLLKSSTGKLSSQEFASLISKTRELQRDVMHILSVHCSTKESLVA